MKNKAVALSLAKSDLKVSVPKTRKASAAASCGRSPETWLVAPDSRPAAGQASRTRPANRVYARGSSAIGRRGARCRSWVQPETVIAWRRPRESPNRRERDASGHERALCRVVLRGGEGGKHGRARDCWPNNTKPRGIAPGLALTDWPTQTGGPTIVAPRAGLEPATLRLTAACSTIELPRNKPVGTGIVADGRGLKPCLAWAATRTAQRLPSVPPDVNRPLPDRLAPPPWWAHPPRRWTPRPVEGAIHEWLARTGPWSARGHRTTAIRREVVSFPASMRIQ